MTSKDTKPLDTKEKIFQATIDIIKDEGMRGVRHRAVATLAGVSLGSTTYHFKSIEDLISSTFLYWNEKIDIGKNPNFLKIKENIGQIPAQSLSVNKLVDSILENVEIYLKRQIIETSDDRKVELAFQHEALKSPMMSELLLNHWEKEVEHLAQQFKVLGAETPQEDAESILALVLHIERKAMFLHNTQQLEAEFPKMIKMLKRQIKLLLSAMLM